MRGFRIPKVRMFRTCTDCGNVKEVKCNQAAGFKRCIDCEQKYRSDNRYFTRICTSCGEEKTVRSRMAAEAIHCRSCADAFRKPRGKSKKAPLERVKKPKVQTRLRVDIDKARRLNHIHKAEIAAKKEVKSVTEKDEQEMIAEFLKHNKVKVAI